MKIEGESQLREIIVQQTAWVYQTVARGEQGLVWCIHKALCFIVMISAIVRNPAIGMLTKLLKQLLLHC